MSEAADLEIVDDAHGVVIRRVVVGPLDTNCWILHGTDSTNALLIDPGDEPTRILDAVGDLSVTAIVLTHSHWDHVPPCPASLTPADATSSCIPTTTPSGHTSLTTSNESATSMQAPPPTSCSPADAAWASRPEQHHGPARPARCITASTSPSVTTGPHRPTAT